MSRFSLQSVIDQNLLLNFTFQDSLREAGILVRLPSLLAGPDRSVQLAAVMACANLALNTGNMKEMEQAVVVMVLLADDRARKVQIIRLNGRIRLFFPNNLLQPSFLSNF